MIKELVKKSRSVRRFHEECPITKEQLAELVDLGRLSPCGANKQYIKKTNKYIAVLDGQGIIKIGMVLKRESVLRHILFF